MKELGKLCREKGMLLILGGILCVYFAAVCLINLSGRPSFYCTDMYADMIFAAKVWQQKSLLPEGWLFGNQLYVVATPVLAALFGAVTANPQIAMALAAVTMTVLILGAFWWMLQSVFSNWEDRLLCMVLFMGLGLYFGDSVGTVNGWQLFFTMCAYYGCYLLNVLLAFGCYLRADQKVGKGFWAMVAVTCALSFGTGIQSLRQTAIMSGPLLGLTVLQLLTDLRKKENGKRRSALVAVLISGANGAGLLFQKTIEFHQTEIFGQMGLTEPGQLLPAAGEGIATMLELFPAETASAAVLRVILLLVSIAAAAELCIRRREEENRKPGLLGALLVLSLLAIFAIDVFTTLKVRSIYYFLLYLLVSVLCAYGFSRRRVLHRWLLLGLTVVALILPGMLALKDICMQAYFARYDPMHTVSEYLLEEGYDTVYAPWNMGEDIAVASDFAIEVGFWDEKMFVPVTYLCDPEIYEADSGRCVYALFDGEGAAQAEQLAAEKGIDFTARQHFPELDIYLYTSSENLMQKFAQ